MQDLIERLEKATGPSREFDFEIWNAAFKHPSTKYWFDAPLFTRSIDAALTLVPKGWSYRVGENEPRTNAQAVLGRSYPTNKTVTQEAAMPAIALCIATLRARAAIANETKTP